MYVPHRYFSKCSVGPHEHRTRTGTWNHALRKFLGFRNEGIPKVSHAQQQTWEGHVFTTRKNSSVPTEFQQNYVDVTS